MPIEGGYIGSYEAGNFNYLGGFLISFRFWLSFFFFMKLRLCPWWVLRDKGIECNFGMR